MQEVIVYHNPAQAWFWHTLMTGHGILMLTGVVLTIWLWFFLLSKISKYHKQHSNAIANFVYRHELKVATIAALLFGSSLYMMFGR